MENEIVTMSGIMLQSPKTHINSYFVSGISYLAVEFLFLFGGSFEKTKPIQWIGMQGEMSR